MAAQTWLVDIPPEDCEAFLASSTLGRLGVVVDGRPEIFAVNHVYDWETHSVVIPSHMGTKLFAALDWPWVAYEVDGMAPDGRAGWSVLVVGRAELVDDAETIARATEQRARKVAWIADGKAQWIRIEPVDVTGRRITTVAHPDAHTNVLPVEELEPLG
jgi:nitroimidazol reductase NimA-like FMN-containing flavoprotein (pyridoxamine 5'-phosphate oxidase superfamily)